MENYSEQQVQNIENENFQFIEVDIVGNILTLTLNRPEKKNALHPKMIDEIAFSLHHAHFNAKIWQIIIKAEGDVFCSGADLKAMRGHTGEVSSSIPDAQTPILLGELFQSVYKPIICLLHANVYAGGMFFVTGSTYVVALDSIQFELSEVRRGLFPFQVMATLMENMQAKDVLKWCITGKSMNMKSALEYRLVDILVETPSDLKEKAGEWISSLTPNSPKAIQLGMEAYAKIRETKDIHNYLIGMLMKSIQSEDGIEGTKAFKEKRTPIWTGK